MGMKLKRANGVTLRDLQVEQLDKILKARSPVYRQKVITFPEGCVEDWAMVDESKVCLVFDFEVTRYWPEGGKTGVTKRGLMVKRTRLL